MPHLPPISERLTRDAAPAAGPGRGTGRDRRIGDRFHHRPGRLDAKPAVDSPDRRVAAPGHRPDRPPRRTSRLAGHRVPACAEVDRRLAGRPTPKLGRGAGGHNLLAGSHPECVSGLLDTPPSDIAHSIFVRSRLAF